MLNPNLEASEWICITINHTNPGQIFLLRHVFGILQSLVAKSRTIPYCFAIFAIAGLSKFAFSQPYLRVFHNADSN